jgi:hypothetical protein
MAFLEMWKPDQMTLYIISYDQHRDRDYTPIWTKLRQWNAVRLLESLWLANLNGEIGAIRDELRNVTRNEDSLAVIELKAGSSWATYSAQKAGVDWLQQHLRRYN